MNKKKLCIFGAGGAAKDAYTIVDALGLTYALDCFLESDEKWTSRKVEEIDVKPFSYFNPKKHKLILAVGDSQDRKNIAGMLHPETEFLTLIHPSAIISPTVKLGEGCIIGAGCIMTFDVIVGNHAYINIATTISHDGRIGEFFTAAPGVNISGNCTIGDNVFIGANSSVREKTTIGDDIKIGMGSIVLNDIVEPGLYFGAPVKKIKNSSDK